MIHKVSILSIKISYEKGKDRQKVNHSKLIENFGLEGDAYAKPGDREVCLMTNQTLKSLENYSDGMCVKRFSESILIDYDPNLIKVGHIIDFNGVQIKVTKLGKKCYPECLLIQRQETCPLSQHIMFGKVVVGGDIFVNQ